MENISLLNHILSSADKLSVVVHTHPDGDAVGSGSAMVSYLSERLGKDARLIVPDAIPDNLSFITEGMSVLDAGAAPEEALERITASDLIVVLDLNDLKRTEQLCPALESSKAVKVLIDHHLRPVLEPFALAFSEPSRSSTCELLYFILKELEQGNIGALPTKCLASLMTGMTTDTNNFNNSVGPDTLKMAGELLQAGVDRDLIIDKLYHSDREERVMAFADMMSRHLTILPCGVSYMIMTEEMQRSYGLEPGETEGLVNQPLNMAKVRMNIFLREENGLFRVSIRSKRGLSARNLADAAFHGGGHECAAGGKLRWPDDIPDRDSAAAYIEEITARFLRNETTN